MVLSFLTQDVPNTSIAGSFKEGGGQILRNATALAAITSQQIFVDNIRASTTNRLIHPTVRSA